jgi:tetratricopeptide (TPR) repeat protein
MESGAWSEFLDLMATADLACKDKETLQWAHLCNSAGLVECERGNSKAAYVHMNTSRRIREKVLPFDHEELANTYNNYANVIMTESQDKASLAMAESMYLKALEIDKSKPEEESALILHIRWLNLATVWMFQKRYAEAIEAVETGRQYAIKKFGLACHFDGE